jgi:integrase/recombinase XerC
MAPFFVLQNFLDFLQTEKRSSQHTLDAYRRDLEQFIQCFDLQDVRDVNTKMARMWIGELNEEGKTNKTINRKLSALRTFHQWMKRQELVGSESTLTLKGPKTEKRLPVFAKQSDMDMAIDKVIDFQNYAEARDQLMVEVLYQTGIRLSELIDLNDSRIGDNQIRVIGKRKKERIIPISKQLRSDIAHVQNLKRSEGKSSDYLFLTDKGEKVYPKLVYRKINSYLGKVTDLESRGPHILRHTFATHLLNNGAGLETIKEILGHASLSATQVYTHNSFTQLSNIYSQAHPRGHNKG